MALHTVAGSFLRELNTSTQEEHLRERGHAKSLVVPHLHKLSHNLKKVATRFAIPVVFSALNKFAHLWPRICQAARVWCAEGVASEIPLSCRLREHVDSIGKSDGAHLPAHVVSTSVPRF